MSRHCFAKELMVRPGGVYPKYGAVDRDYYGSEYGGFQDVFTMALATNFGGGRLEPARKMLDNYLTHFTATQGTANEKQIQLVGRFSDRKGNLQSQPN